MNIYPTVRLIEGDDRAAVVAAIPHPVLGGAALAMFAAVAVVGIQTLSRVDFNDHRNIVIVGTSLGLGMLVTAQPNLAAAFPGWAQTVFGSGITLAAITAILLNLLFNHVGRGSLSPAAAVAGRPGGLIGLDAVNSMDAETFEETFGGLVENTPWVLERAWAMRPFADTLALRAAFQNALITGSSEEQLQLMNSFADLGSAADAHNDYRLDPAEAGAGDLDADARREVHEMAQAYRGHFGFPLIVCARDIERYQRAVLEGWSRMANAVAVERAAGLIEIARIANARFNDLVADANPIQTARARAYRNA